VTRSLSLLLVIDAEHSYYYVDCYNCPSHHLPSQLLKISSGHKSQAMMKYNSVRWILMFEGLLCQGHRIVYWHTP
jgi:hypothetical protein